MNEPAVTNAYLLVWGHTRVHAAKPGEEFSLCGMWAGKEGDGRPFDLDDSLACRSCSKAVRKALNTPYLPEDKT